VGACGELCHEYSELTPESCGPLCNGLDDECGQAACARLCRSAGLSPEECLEACPDFDTPYGIGSCYITCLGRTGPAECRDLCGGSGTPCGESGCWQICGDHAELETCIDACGLGTPCGIVRCYERAYRFLDTPFEEWRRTCGFVEGRCECLLTTSVREICLETCLESGETRRTCDALCALY
jgi:hypothetical protein